MGWWPLHIRKAKARQHDARHIRQASGIVFVPNASHVLGVELPFLLYGHSGLVLLTSYTCITILHDQDVLELSVCED